MITKTRMRRIAEVMAGSEQTFSIIFYIVPSDGLTPNERFDKKLKGEVLDNDKMTVDIDFDGPEEMLSSVNQKLGYDLLSKIKEMANKIKPNECIDDYEYVEMTGINGLKSVQNNNGEQVLEIVPSGYKVMNKLVFNNRSFYPVEDVAFLEIQFKVN